MTWIILSPVRSADLSITDTVFWITDDGKARGMTHAVTASGGTASPPLVTHRVAIFCHPGDTPKVGEDFVDAQDKPKASVQRHSSVDER